VKKVILLVVLLLSFTVALFMMQQEKEVTSKRVQITVSTFALYDIVRAIGAEEVDVRMAIPFGVDVHSFEPTPQTIIKIKKSELFLYSGAELEPWIENLAVTDNMYDMSQYVQLRKITEHDDDDDDHHDAHHHHHGSYDPHYWLDISNMRQLAQKIALMLVKADPAHEADYVRRAADYIEALEKLDKAYQNSLKECQVHEVIVHHNILGYVAPRYGFEVETLTGLSPDALADAQTMARLSREIRSKKIDVIFFESFVSDRLMQSLAKENGIRLDYLEPLANITAEQAEEHMSYSDGMYENLKKLTAAMRCE